MPLYFREYGERGRPPLLLLHGLFGSSSNWGSVARRLSEDYYLLVPDLMNHGRSPHDPAVSYPAMAADLIALLDQQGIGRIDLVGHSMGGKVVMELALSAPERVNHLVAVDISPVDYGQDFVAVFSGFAAVDPATLTTRNEADQRMAAHVPDAHVRAFLLQNLVADGDSWRWRINLQALQQGIRLISDFPQWDTVFEGRTLFLHGAESDYVNPDYHDEIRRLFPTSDIQAVSGAGHWTFADQPEEFIRQLKIFLANDD